PRAAGVTVLGRVSDAERWRLLRSADVLVNPSPHESFSLVVLEAWQVGTPVLVNGWCGPLVEHCLRSGGGLWYTGAADFSVGLERLLDPTGPGAELARAGARYVETEFAWPVVRARYEALLDRIT
ncbi:MAG: glycosyltransferase, partial [Acidimicrobiales bacterium]